MRTKIIKYIPDIALFKEQLLYWAQQYREIVYLDSNREVNENQLYQSYDLILAVEAFTSLKTDYYNAFNELSQYQLITKDWIFGYLTYDLKNGIENLKSNNNDGLEFPDLFFFQPKKLFLLKGNNLEIHYLNMCDDELEDDFCSIFDVAILIKKNQLNSEIHSKIDKENYLKKVSKIQEHIQRGDIYEMNFCMEYFIENVDVNLFHLYQNLNEISQTPFSVFFKNNDHYLVSASPERYLKKSGKKVISQPIKGTRKRHTDKILDNQLVDELNHDIKEKSENIMIVDLVRNDLSKTAKKGSVQVEELCKVYSFLQVHQMISTIVSEVAKDLPPVEIIKTTFPMGSMTGAPKVAAMEIIEKYEETKRGLYSGAVGYFTPKGNFDFNVVIRSILYNANKKYLSFSVGSAITAKSIPELEYEECLIKAKAMKEVLSN